MKEGFRMIKVFWNEHKIAESENTEFVEGNHYFPLFY